MKYRKNLACDMIEIYKMFNKKNVVIFRILASKMREWSIYEQCG